MRRTWLAFVFGLAVALVAATGYLLLTPVSALAATGSAKCPGGWEVVCPGNGTATNCNCTDYSGCTATFADGSTRTNNCDDWVITY